MSMLSHAAMHRLSDYVGGRDNNFNLLRFMAAMMVLYSHSFALALGASGAEPWIDWGVTPGSVAVDIFFVTSGFLVTGSLIARKDLCSFVKARALRIYPALLVVAALTIFGFGAYFTTLTFHDYLFDAETIKYALRNATLFAGCCGHLPHVFDDNPIAGAINGSLWTMPWEVRMYALLLGIGVIARVTHWRENVWKALIVIAAGAFSATYVINHYWPVVSFMKDDRALRLGMMFFVGATFFAFKERIHISHLSAYVSIALVALAMLAGEWLFLPVYTLLVGYVALHLAYLPSGGIRHFNRLGDYSYGVYIYAFPIQQSIVALEPGISGMRVFMIALPCVLLFSMLSWHFVEKKSLRLKDRNLACI